jgi:hypothetical protein
MAGKVIIIDSVDLVEVDLSPRYAFLRLVPLPDPEADDSKPEAKAELQRESFSIYLVPRTCIFEGLQNRIRISKVFFQ